GRYPQGGAAARGLPLGNARPRGGARGNRRRNRPSFRARRGATLQASPRDDFGELRARLWRAQQTVAPLRGGCAPMHSGRPRPAELRAGEAAAWGAPPPTETSRISLLALTARQTAGGQRAYVTVRVSPPGIVIRDCGVFVGPRGPWVNLPSKPI